MNEMAETSITEWFADKSILVTGATGFMGKVLVEKLLRSCPSIRQIFLLVRPKRGRDPLQRLEDFIESPVFDIIRDSDVASKLFAKLRCIPGDVAQPHLNLSAFNAKMLQNEVDIVFHMAANVRFDQPLKTALLLNTGGTLRVLETAERFSNLKVFVHVSTAYCHCDIDNLEEMVYAAPHHPKKMLDLVSWMDDDLLQMLTPRLLRGLPNTYAYTKCLTEQLVADYSTKFPVAITRPSIVTASWKQPFAGWVENLNGPTGLLVGAGKGVIRSMHCNPNYVADIMPVDLTINCLILVAWELGTQHRTNEPLVVNITASEDNPITWGDALETGKKHFFKNPFSICLWYPGGSIKTSYLLHMIAVIFLHFLPAYAIDFALTLSRRKPFLVQTQRRIQNGLEVLQYYTTREWKFVNRRIKKIFNSLPERDQQRFDIDLSKVKWDQYILDYVLGARRYCVHEEPQTIPSARRLLKKLYYLDLLKNLTLLALAVWFIYTYFAAMLNTVDSTLRLTAHKLNLLTD